MMAYYRHMIMLTSLVGSKKDRDNFKGARETTQGSVIQLLEFGRAGFLVPARGPGHSKRDPVSAAQPSGSPGGRELSDCFGSFGLVLRGALVLTHSEP